MTERIEAAENLGSAQRALGLPIESCPPYRREEESASWREGWRRRDEEINRREENRK